MADYFADYGRNRERAGGDAHGVVNRNLDVVESGVDTAIDSTKQVVHELRGKAQEVADGWLDRVNRSWEEQRPRVERYMDAHPWIVLGGLLLLAYLFSASDRRYQGPVIYSRHQI